MTSDTTWLTLPDVAERLGLPVTRVREFLRERQLLAVRREGDGVLHLPESFLIAGESGMEAIPTLRGTIFVLADAGLTDDEVMRWLLRDNDELGEAPIAALRAGKKTVVRRIAQTSF
ncbi:MAG: Rv2175c family DNA-binding protein [Demequinaceae bacterium]|nr:Rv2175c family DNA-binding protein [Demequinaceae bacterium]